MCIFLMKGMRRPAERAIVHADAELFISEVTLAELKYGIAKSERQEQNQESLDRFLVGVRLLPISDAIDLFASEKARLSRTGDLIPDFDLLIGATAIVHGMTLVTNNTKHFQRLRGIRLEDWTR